MCLKVWDTVGLRLTRIPLESTGRDPRISADGRYIVSMGSYADEDGFYWDIFEAPSGPRILRAELSDKTYMHHAAFSPGGRFVADGGDHNVRLWNLASGELVPAPLGLS